EHRHGLCRIALEPGALAAAILRDDGSAVRASAHVIEVVLLEPQAETQSLAAARSRSGERETRFGAVGTVMPIAAFPSAADAELERVLREDRRQCRDRRVAGHDREPRTVDVGREQLR